MAETRNIKDLPQTDAMTSGDFFLIESPAGTQLLSFDNFVIDQDNTTFATDLLTNMTTLSTQVTAVSSDLDLTGANAAAKLYVVNTSLTERIDSLSDTLYGALFEGQIQEFIAANPEDPITSDDRGLDGNLRALSAMIFDELFGRIKALSASIAGDEELGGHIQGDSRNLTYTGNGRLNISENDGGLLGAILDTVSNTIDVRLSEAAITFNSSNPDSGTVSISIPGKYVVNRGSLSHTLEFTNEANVGVGGVNPYTQPGQFVIVGFEQTDGSGGTISHTWRIKRVGGAPFTDDEYPIRLHARIVSAV